MVMEATNNPCQIHGSFRDFRNFRGSHRIGSLLAWIVGIVVTLSNPQRSVGYGLCILIAIIGGFFSFLLWFSINAI